LAITYLRPAPETRVVQFEVSVGEKVQPGHPAISPDGQYVAISAADQGLSRIWLRALNSRAMIPLPGTEGGQWPFWSPDSLQIGFSTETALKKISLAGGSPQTICNVPGTGTWSRDGVIIFSTPTEPGLYRVNAAGGEPKPLTTRDRSRQETEHDFTQFLPDGRRFIYQAGISTPENSGTYLGSLDSPEVKRIHDGVSLSVYAPPGFLIFNRGPSLMAQRFDLRKAELYGDPMLVAESVAAMFGNSPFGSFSVSGNGVLAYLPGFGSARTQLVWFDRTGRRLGTMAEPADYSNPAISPDQKMVAVGKRDPQTNTRDIWVIDLQRGASSRFTFDPSDDTNPAWSPDGTRIAFTSDRKGHRDIYVKPASGSGEEQLVLESSENKYVEDWSSDGQYLLWGTNTEERLFSFKEHKSLPLPKFTEDQGRFCPSRSGPPRWFAYTSGETGAPQVYVRSFAALSGSGGKWQISTGGGTEPFWRRDGNELFYLNGNKLICVEVNGDGESFQAGIPRQLFETPLPLLFARNRYVVTADGKRFLMTALVEEKRAASFTVVLNWPGLLKR
jgi:eukaryotic-like serine/threonine-protein kinase